MNLDIFHNFQLDLISFLQAFRSPLLDQIMIFLNFFDSNFFYYPLIIGIWYGYNRKLGIELAFVFIVGVILNQDVKELFALPRPHHLRPELGVLAFDSYGFPSGGAQMIMTVFGYLSLKVKKRWFTVLSILLILTVSLARVYLGVHFLTDILGGWLLGVITFLGAIYALPRIEQFLSYQTKAGLFLLSLLGAICLGVPSLNIHALLKVFLGFGVCIGLILAQPLPETDEMWKRFLRTSVALFGVCVLTELTASILGEGTYDSSLSLFIIGFWISYGVVFVCTKIESTRRLT